MSQRGVMAGARRMVQMVKAHPVVSPRDQAARNVRLFYLNTAMLGVPFGGIVAFMPVFLARLGASSSLVGWLTSAPALLAAISYIPGAAIAERFADQVMVRVTCARIVRLTFLLCALLPFVIPSESFSILPVVLVVLWSIQAVFDAVAVPAWTSVLARAIPPRQRARLNGTRWALLAIVSAVSSAFFGWLLDQVAFPLNYQIVFAISFALGWLDPMFFARIVVPHIEVSPRGDKKRGLCAAARDALPRLIAYLRPVTRERRFLIFLLATTAYRVALAMPSPLFSLFWVNELGASDSLIGLRGTVGNAALVLGYVVWGRLADRIGHRQVLAMAAGGLAFYPAVTALSQSAAWILPAAAIWGVTVSGLDVGLFDLMLLACPEKRHQRFVAASRMVANLAMFLGPLIGVALADATSISTALLVIAGAQIVTMAPFLLLPREDPCDP